MLTRFNWRTLTDALVWPLASARNVLNRHGRMSSSPQSMGSIVYFWRRHKQSAEESWLVLLRNSIVVGKVFDRCPYFGFLTIAPFFITKRLGLFPDGIAFN
jgi:hypothetical protein